MLGFKSPLQPDQHTIWHESSKNHRHCGSISVSTPKVLNRNLHPYILYQSCEISSLGAKEIDHEPPGPNCTPRTRYNHLTSSQQPLHPKNVTAPPLTPIRTLPHDPTPPPPCATPTTSTDHPNPTTATLPRSVVFAKKKKKQKIKLCVTAPEQRS